MYMYMLYVCFLLEWERTRKTGGNLTVIPAKDFINTSIIIDVSYLMLQ